MKSKISKKIKNRILFITLSVATLTAQAYDGGSSTVGPGNPATINCLKLGGALERIETPKGQDANCVIECWKLYGEMSKRGLLKPHHYENIAVPNPAAVNCLDIKGTLRSETTPEGTRTLCVVGQWDLFRAINVIREK